MTQFIKRTRPTYRVLICMAILLAGSIQGVVLKWDWTTEKIKDYEKKLSYLTAENINQHTAFRTLITTVENIETELQENVPDNTIITELFKALQGKDIAGMLGGWWSSSPDPVKTVWTTIKTYELISAKPNNISFEALDTSWKSTPANIITNYKNRAIGNISEAMLACIREYKKNYDAEEAVLTQVIDGNYTLDGLKKIYATRRDQFTTLVATQAKIDTFLNLLIITEPNPTNLYDAMLAITTSLKASLNNMRFFYDGLLIKGDKVIQLQNIKDTIASYKKIPDTNLKTAFEYGIKLSFYSAIQECLETKDIKTAITDSTNPVIFYDALKIPSSPLIKFINAYPIAQAQAIQTSFAKYTLTNGAQRFNDLNEAVVNAAKILTLMPSKSGDLKNAIALIKSNLPAITAETPFFDPRKIYDVELDSLTNKTITNAFDIEALRAGYVTPTNDCFTAITKFLNAYKTSPTDTGTKQLFEEVKKQAKRAITHTLLWTQVATDNQIKKAKESAVGLSATDDPNITIAFINTIIVARDTKPALDKAFNATVSTIYNTNMAPVLNEYEATISGKQPAPIKTPATTPKPSTPPSEIKEAAQQKLFAATKINNLQDAKDALAAGADINGLNSNKNTALLSAAIHGSTAVAKLLIDKGADLNKLDILGNTALIDAFIYEHNDIAKLLITAGADITIKNKKNESAYDLAPEGDIRKILADKLKLPKAPAIPTPKPPTTPPPSKTIPSTTTVNQETQKLLINFATALSDILGKPAPTKIPPSETPAPPKTPITPAPAPIKTPTPPAPIKTPTFQLFTDLLGYGDVIRTAKQEKLAPDKLKEATDIFSETVKALKADTQSLDKINKYPGELNQELLNMGAKLTQDDWREFARVHKTLREIHKQDIFVESDLKKLETDINAALETLAKKEFDAAKAKGITKTLETIKKEIVEGVAKPVAKSYWQSFTGWFGY